MKKILFRKFLFDCLVFFLIALFSTGIIIWVFQAVNFLDIIIEDGRNYLVYLNFSLLNFPKVISKLVPFVLFFSFLFIIGKYELNNELIIFWNFGINKIELINFFIKFSFLIMFFQIFLTSLIVPKSQDLARSFLRTSSINYLENFIKPKTFNEFYIELICDDGEEVSGRLFLNDQNVLDYEFPLEELFLIHDVTLSKTFDHNSKVGDIPSIRISEENAPVLCEGINFFTSGAPQYIGTDPDNNA